MKIFGLFLLCTLAIAEDWQNAANPVVHSPAGSFRGLKSTSHLGRDLYSFRGIRYGLAPTGQQRFQAASPVPPFQGVSDATQNGPVCVQPVHGNQQISEDCLRLNVYTNAFPQESSDVSQNAPERPVVVFIHPGSHWEPFGSSYGLGPKYALDEDIVLVTINYRVGSLGFLSTGDSRAPGNQGLKDQVLALKWVQENIRSFGGDPSLVTLAGQGIGAESVTLHVVSPLSRGLFHRAIAFGGAVATHNRLPADRKDLALKQSELLGCPTDSLDKVFECLYEKSPEDFANSYEQLAEFYGHPALLLPVAEAQTANNDESWFLRGQPADEIREGRANFVPFYSGVTQDEFGYLAIRAEEQALSGDNRLYDQLNNNWAELAPKRFNYERGTPKSLQISEALRSFYLEDKNLSAGRYSGLANLYSDLLSNFAVDEFQRLMARYSPKAVWNLLFAYETCDTYSKWSNGQRFGVVHYDPLLLLFNVDGRPDLCERDAPRVREIWGSFANFARNGNPTRPNNANKNSNQWEHSTAENHQYYEYKGEEKRMVQGSVHKARLDKLYEIFSSA